MSNDSQKRIQKIIDLYLADDDVDEQLSERFRAWLGENGHLDEKYEALEKAFEREVRPDPNPGNDIREAYRRLVETIGAREAANRSGHRRLRRKWALRIAAVVVPACIAAASVFYIRGLHTHENFDVSLLSDVIESAGQGTQKHVILPDGSQVWLKNGSDVGYCENFLTERTVYLDGEAFFSVKASKERPFTVKSHCMAAVVTGTKFNVRAYCDSLTSEVVLAEGVLDVTCGRKTYHMTANTHIRIDNKSADISLCETAETERPRWMSQLRFQNTPIEQALHIIAEFFDVTIDSTAELPPEEKFTAVFEEAPSLDKVLFALQNATMLFDYEIAGNTVRITPK